MLNLSEMKQKANSLRKEGSYQEALSMYRELWQVSGDKFDDAGLLNCLRKLELIDEALVFSEELITKYPNFNWARNEVIWTYIYGEFYNLYKDNDLDSILHVAKKIMNFNPELIAAKLVVLKVSKLAKDSKRWDILNEWIIKIDPNLLNSEPIINDSGKKGWSEQSRWYYYRTLGRINQGQTNDALVLIDYALEHFPGQAKFFQKLKAEAYCNLGNLDEAEKIYQNICNSKRVDWWILHRYSQLFMAKGSKEDALRLMCQAASMNSKLDVMVTLFADIGKLCFELKMIEEARAHLSLCKYIREQKGWSRSELLLAIDDLNKIIGNNNEPADLKDSLQICECFWVKQLGSERISINNSEERRSTRYNLLGNIYLGPPDRPFCFINNKTESFFCYKSDLLVGITDGDKVKFDGIPSFDKKKQKDSWKAANIFLIRK